MIDFWNPYTPGVGMMPKYLAGRDTELESVKQRLLAIKSWLPGSFGRVLRSTRRGQNRRS